MRIYHSVFIISVVFVSLHTHAAKHRKPKMVRPSSVHLVGADFHAKVPQGWFNLERIQLEETRATDDVSKRELNRLLASYRLARAEGEEIMLAGIGETKTLMTVSPIESSTIDKARLADESYCQDLGKKMMQPGQKLDYAGSIGLRNGSRTCSLGSSLSTGRKYAGIIMRGKSNAYLVMTTTDKGVELPLESLQAFVDSWYLR